VEENSSNLAPVPRPRKYTWPMTLTGKERKKAQNKLASRRFRQRRKQEQSCVELQAHQLEQENRKLREKAGKLEEKIQQLKRVMEMHMLKTEVPEVLEISPIAQETHPDPLQWKQKTIN